MLNTRFAYLGARARRRLTSRAALIRLVETTDPDTGVTTQAERTVAVYPCELQARSSVPVEAPEGGVLVARSAWVVYLDREAAVNPEDRLSIDGVAYAVVESNRGRTYQPLQAVSLRKVV